MSSTAQIIEGSNYKRLESDNRQLRDDPHHRREFHKYLEQVFIRGVDKPETYGELESAYKDFLRTL